MSERAELLSYEEIIEYRALAEELEQNARDELDTIDGWDTAPRDNPLAEYMPKDSQIANRHYIVPGHIALLGDFDIK